MAVHSENRTLRKSSISRMLIFLVAAIGILSVPERARAQQPPTYAITHAKISRSPARQLKTALW